VSRSLADYIVGIAGEERPAYPSIGLSFKKFQGLENLVIDTKPIDGAALGQNFEKGDVVLDVDGKSYADANELRTYLAQFGYDAEVKFRLLRAGQEKSVTLKIRPQAPAPPAEKKESFISGSL
jgi:S1-C subfamily serine protease